MIEVEDLISQLRDYRTEIEDTYPKIKSRIIAKLKKLDEEYHGYTLLPDYNEADWKHDYDLEVNIDIESIIDDFKEIIKLEHAYFKKQIKPFEDAQCYAFKYDW